MAYTYSREPLPRFLDPFPEWIHRVTRRSPLLKVGSAFSRTGTCYQEREVQRLYYSKADLKQRVLFFITIFRLAIPAFFGSTDVTELM